MNICLLAKFQVRWYYGFGSTAFQQDLEEEEEEKEEEEEEEDKEHEKTSFAVFPGCYVEIHLFLVNFFWLYVLDIDVTRNGNNLKLKVKSEFSLSMGLMVINHMLFSYC